MDAFAQNLRKYRTEKNLSMQELADKLSLASKSAISLYETGKRQPTFETLIRISNVLEVSVDDLFYSDNPERLHLDDYRNEAGLLDIESIIRTEGIKYKDMVLNEDQKDVAIGMLRVLADARERGVLND
ncbi:helix-turn-helix domain-containing protein [Cytobacillus oceanisediminis]|uniref:helix-turn-helix domain-containing protein n=1 Tax=Cytobacillus oceanisediminis TaxID=665099 RepID=UPI001FB44545|nr:helix-turn-helix transcriptional regulator [Cytobacillus oceanisediminis]UOE58026.1 helix-turn-helix transcriptional regulator [Cytobacillus oceanisediminis]